MQQTNLCGITFPLSKQSLYKLISTLKEIHFCGENLQKKELPVGNLAPPFLQGRVTKRGVTGVSVLIVMVDSPKNLQLLLFVLVHFPIFLSLIQLFFLY